MNADGVAAALTTLTGVLFVVAAILSLQSQSQLRRLYGIDVTDDEAAKINAVVVGLGGVGMWALAAAVIANVSERVIGTATVIVCAGLCIILGWLIRYHDRRELLTTPDADRDLARRLGAAAIICGVLILPLAPAIWLRASDALVLGLVLGGACIGFFTIAYAHR
ncbi:hypothetical protein [Halomicrococcus sp. NG-SE-24]|uniref:hypothetical protein n=1 Tax=Halomicrococcus sp. NG-SE-24 TaxID=3436928 RepID=UPI003D968718